MRIPTIVRRDAARRASKRISNVCGGGVESESDRADIVSVGKAWAALIRGCMCIGVAQWNWAFREFCTTARFTVSLWIQDNDGADGTTRVSSVPNIEAL